MLYNMTNVVSCASPWYDYCFERNIVGVWKLSLKQMHFLHLTIELAADEYVTEYIGFVKVKVDCISNAGKQ